ncbi:bone morphogenetic protein receptor type-2 [Cimex lectularius]|uniref:receptor protein serine/threonine kinase n=1 Tax=Cimex lectularius TaxID=79782 RepID=A0A8I6RFY7_CIMLE|nr:bone morphogenetic protein receptor type-2 [Cimex lectularius]
MLVLKSTFVLFIAVQIQELNAQRVCARSQETGTTLFEDLVYAAREIDDNDIQKDQEVCKKGTQTCYAFWKKGNSNENITFFSAGCWEISGQGECTSSVCQPQSHPRKSLVNAMFCCCTGNLCNTNISFNSPVKEGEPLEETSLSAKPSSSMYNSGENREWKVIVLGGCGGLLFLLFLTIVFVVWGPTTMKKKTNHVPPQQPPPKEANNSYSLSQLSLDKIVGQGRYGTVWLGHLKGQQVAVKMFPMHYSQYFYNEKDIYTLPFMEHSSLLKYLGSDEFPNKNGLNSLALVLSYCPLGTLQEYLKRNTLDTATFIRMALSTTSGLAHLHTEIHKKDKWKPCITHRDVNTKNILVKEDLSCCLVDLGLAVKITGSHYYTLGEEQHAETKSINDVGTLRYMAPEVLEGAVNLRDCESSLKQVDVYALGLVLWEIAMRVVDFYNRPNDVLPYTLPFEKEVGLHPTFEEMQVLVSKNKARPLFPQEWKCNLMTTTIRETIEDCVDQDGEARLTVLCVHERINHLHRGSLQVGNISPTFNQTNTSFSAPSNNNNIKFLGSDMYQGDKEMADGCVSEGTVETMITLSPSEPYPVYLSTVSKEPIIQPHQGRNRCLERNLLSCDSSEELCIVQTSSKHKRFQNRDLFEESESLMRDTASHQTSIPYVQNKPFMIPKQVNTPVKGQTGLVASLMKLIKKKEEPAEDTASLTHVIVSPFEEQPPRRPSSLQLIPVADEGQVGPVQEDEFEEKRLKELSSRIRTPGDLPPSVRKKRGSKARLSLYDDRMMSNSVLDSTF